MEAQLRQRQALVVAVAIGHCGWHHDLELGLVVTWCFYCHPASVVLLRASPTEFMGVPCLATGFEVALQLPLRSLPSIISRRHSCLWRPWPGLEAATDAL